jgi:hypothetical protein
MPRDPDSPPDDRRLPRRATDRVEDVVACLLMAVAFVVLVLAWSSGTAVYRANLASASTLNQTRAVLLEDAASFSTGEPPSHLPARVEAKWVDRTGTERIGQIRVADSALAGTAVDVWLRPDGVATTTDPGRGNALTAGLITAAGLLFAGGAVLAVVWFGVRSLTAAVNSRRWEREWARVGPEWTPGG